MKKIRTHYQTYLGLSPSVALTHDAFDSIYFGEFEDAEGRDRKLHEFGSAYHARMHAIGRQKEGILTYVTWVYKKEGEQVFSVGPRMRGLFENTDLKGLNFSDVKLPYSTFYVHFPETLYTHLHLRYCGVYVTSSVSLRPAYGEADYILCVFVTEDGNPGYCVPFGGVIGDSGLGMGGEEDVETYLSRQISLNGAPLRGDGDVDEEGEERLLLALGAMVRVTFNLLVYLGCSNAEREELPRANASLRKKLEREREKYGEGHRRGEEARAELRALSEPLVTLIAPTIEGAPPTTHRTDTGRHAPVAHMVRGHYRRYHVGEGRTATIRKWVQPFLRSGGEAAERSHYEVR